MYRVILVEISIFRDISETTIENLKNLDLTWLALNLDLQLV